jgi:Uncharacterized distant relative of cell wall-associated hydrolases
MINLKAKIKSAIALMVSTAFLFSPISVLAFSPIMPKNFDWAAERAREEAIFDKFEKMYKNKSYPKMLNAYSFDNCVGGEALVTRDSSSTPDIPFIGHAGIVREAWRTVESGASDGVHEGTSTEWLGKDEKTGKYYKKTVFILKCPEKYNKTEPVQEWAYMQKGKPYNWNFFDRKRTDKYYCSQLVCRAYLEALNIDLCPGAVSYVSPADILKSSKLTVYWSRED